MKPKILSLSLVVALANFTVSFTAVQAENAADKDGHEHGAPGEEAHGPADHENHGDHDEDESEEGVVRLSPDAVEAAELDIRKAGPATLSMKLKVNGRIAPVSSKVAHIAPRFSGVIKEVRRDVGDAVKAGEVLAVVESNQNLQPFEVRTITSGVITDRHATIGESVQEDEAIFIVMDLRELWADFTLFQRDVAKVALGQPNDKFLSPAAEPVKSSVSFISPVVDETTQSRVVRAAIVNSSRELSPGAFVTGRISVGEFTVPLAVTQEAVQTIEGRQVVFVQENDRFEKRDVTLGRSDGTLTEVLSGVQPHEKYASQNTFILKAELGKSEAGHEH